MQTNIVRLELQHTDLLPCVGQTDADGIRHGCKCPVVVPPALPQPTAQGVKGQKRGDKRGGGGI